MSQPTFSSQKRSQVLLPRCSHASSYPSSEEGPLTSRLKFDIHNVNTFSGHAKKNSTHRQKILQKNSKRLGCFEELNLYVGQSGNRTLDHSQLRPVKVFTAKGVLYHYYCVSIKFNVRSQTEKRELIT